MSFEIVTDSTSNLSLEQIKKKDIKIISLSYFVDGTEYCGHEQWLKGDCSVFFKQLKEKRQMTTSLPPYGEYAPMFKALASEHKDILYLGFSSGLSGTFNTVEHFLVDLQEQYPEQKIRAIDTLCASCGEGLIVDYAVKLRDEGKTIDEVYEYLQKFKFKICHEFLLDDLFYINRGGRLSFTSAIAGSILQIKPLLHVMNNGLPEITQKVRGRKAGLNALVDHLEKMMDPQECKMVYICHANCENDAKELAQLIKKRLRIKNCVIRYSDPIIGLHTGSGAIGIFFVGNAR